MLKAAARKLYKDKRLKLQPAEQMKLDDLLLIQFQSADIPFLESLLTYWPIEENNEPDTHLFTEFLKFRNPELKVCYPVSDFATQTMQAVQADVDTPFVRTDLNIHEPQGLETLPSKQLDIIFVPLIAADMEGFRVGYGKGFYDRYLATCREDCIKVGFSYFEPVDRIEDRDEFDIPLDICITPASVYVF